MIRVALFFLFEVFYLIWTLRLRPRYNALKKRGDIAGADEVVFGVAHRWARTTLAAAGATVEVDGLENLPADHVPAVYVGNHQGDFDSMLVLGYLGGAKALLAKQVIRNVPIASGWMERFRCVFVNREDPRGAATAFRTAAATVSEGYPMIIFPEGTRSKTGEVAEFKAGAFRIAQKSHAMVVPFCLDGTRAFFEGNGYRFNRRSVMRLRVLEPIDTSAYTREDWKALPALCEEKVRTALAVMRAEEAAKQKTA